MVAFLLSFWLVLAFQSGHLLFLFLGWLQEILERWHGIEVKRTHSTGLEFWLPHLLTIWLDSYLTSIYFHFLICKMGILVYLPIRIVTGLSKNRALRSVWNTQNTIYQEHCHHHVSYKYVVKKIMKNKGIRKNFRPIRGG